jgi:hypothetical protein
VNKTAILFNQINRFCPTGKSLLVFRNRVKPLLQKYFCFSQTQISSLIRPVPSHRGALANVINAGRDAVDAGGAKDEGAGRVRPSRVVLTP